MTSYKEKKKSLELLRFDFSEILKPLLGEKNQIAHFVLILIFLSYVGISITLCLKEGKDWIFQSLSVISITLCLKKGKDCIYEIN